jgi:NDP-sugar pyrophosphorylase family protein
MDHAHITMAILAAGEGSRLKQEGMRISKALIPIAGVPMIERIMQIGLRHGVAQIHVIVNEESRDVQQYLMQRKQDLPLNVIVRSTPSSMHSLFAFAPLLNDQPFLLSTVDSIFRESEFAAYLDAAATCPADGMLAVTHFIEDEKPLCVVTDTDDRVLQFSDTTEGFDLATGGLYWFSPRIFDAIPEAFGSGTERLRNFLRLLLARSYDLRIFRFSKMVDVDHVFDLDAAESLALDDERETIDRVRMHR